MAIVTVTSLAVGFSAFADSNTSVTVQNGQKMGWMNRGRTAGPKIPVVVGTVSAINGNVITISGKQGFGATTATTFTVDATNAKITKAKATVSISSVAIGDMVLVQGTITGTNVVATAIHDGMMPASGQSTRGPQDTLPSPIVGNGQPIVAGAVTALSGSTISITNKSNVSYVINATNAKIIQGQNTVIALSNITIGDSLIVQGVINGNSVTASSIIDQPRSVESNQAPKNDSTGTHVGFIGGIGAFFGKLFGF